jgi:hypothetical protein
MGGCEDNHRIILDKLILSDNFWPVKRQNISCSIRGPLRAFLVSPKSSSPLVNADCSGPFGHDLDRTSIFTYLHATVTSRARLAALARVGGRFSPCLALVVDKTRFTVYFRPSTTQVSLSGVPHIPDLSSFQGSVCR